MIQPPTSRLPPIAKIAAFTSTQLFEHLQFLHSLYLPQVRGSRRRRRDRDGNAVSSLDLDDEGIRWVQSDALERAYAVRWLTALIVRLKSRQEQWSLLTSPTDTVIDTGTQSPLSSDLPMDTDTLIQQAASLLATCAGVAAAPKVHRRFSFEIPLPASMPIAGDTDSNKIMTRTVHVDLTDIPLDNHDYASVGAQTWGGACVLAEMIAERPDWFGSGCSTGARWSLSTTGSDTDGLDTRERPLRVLELGAGTGLVGLTVAKLLHTMLPCKSPNPDPTLTLHPRATIVLTDFYPAVLANLQSNIDANFPTVPDENDAAILIHSHPLDWSSFSPTMTETLPIPVLSAPFDVVFGADIVYEPQHAVWIRDCLTSLLSYPDGSNKDPAFHLVIPLRPGHTLESSTIEEVFSSKGRGSKGSQRELTILSKESIVCEAYGDGKSERSNTDNDVEYVYYRIGWTR
ncbi:hypothetical protein J3R82DRAFT_7010 [Butyriboletus roseoflavus]|nr:hypothetical protein J3R82DRAFT_7010 [Butyriboletus roseoflavus]